MSNAQDYDNSDWQFTNLIQTGKQRWTALSEKFWRVPAAIKDDRYAVCQQCEQFIPVTTQCKACLCAMGIKTWLGGFSCPLEKWHVAEKPDKM